MAAGLGFVAFEVELCGVGDPPGVVGDVLGWPTADGV
jgi:hypothetical protein